MPQKKTPDNFINELREKSPDTIPLETYINSSTWAKDGRLIEGTPKTGRGRVISVPDEVLSMLAAWQRQQADINGVLSISYCFTGEDSHKPISPDAVTRWFSRFSKRHELPHINPHAFRHTQASIILQSGDIVAASSRLGHSRESTTTDIYGHMMNATDQKAAEQVGKAFFKSGRAYEKTQYIQ